MDPFLEGSRKTAVLCHLNFSCIAFRFHVQESPATSLGTTATYFLATAVQRRVTLWLRSASQ
jgi:hypothetical protein